MTTGTQGRRKSFEEENALGYRQSFNELMLIKLYCAHAT